MVGEEEAFFFVCQYSTMLIISTTKIKSSTNFQNNLLKKTVNRIITRDRGEEGSERGCGRGLFTCGTISKGEWNVITPCNGTVGRCLRGLRLLCRVVWTRPQWCILRLFLKHFISEAFLLLASFKKEVFTQYLPSFSKSYTNAKDPFNNY